MITINNLLFLIVFISILINLYKINRPLYYYIFTSLLLVMFVISKDVKITLGCAGLVTLLVYIFLDKQIPLRLKKTNVREILKREHFKTKPKPKPKKKTTKEKFTNDEEEDDEEEESVEENFEPSNNTLDTKASYMNVIEKLTPQETRNLNATTRELISTQRQLMETLQTMGPALKEGQTILNTFKNYFNDSNLTDTLKI
jgi:hypothetical protein